MEIRTLEDLEQAAKDRQAITVRYPYAAARIPAAFIMNMPAAQVLKMIRFGMSIYVRGPREH